MAFGFFKKKNFADIIYMNGHVYTQDPAFPWASAVACKDGKVMAVGDYDAMDEITGDNTEVFNLNEQYMFPGFIDAHGTPVLKVMEGKYFEIDQVWDMDTCVEMLEEYADDNEDAEILFGYGFNEHIMQEFQDAEDAHSRLDDISTEIPIILMATTGVHFWVNTLAAQMIEQAASDDGVMHISPSYIINTMCPLDYEEVERDAAAYQKYLREKGITSSLSLNAPDYFSNLYKDTLLVMDEEEETVNSRFHSTLYINRPFNPEIVMARLNIMKTNCTELQGMVTADTLVIEMCDDEDLSYFSQEALDTICTPVADRGFNIIIDAADSESAEKAVNTFEMLRSKGYKNNTFVLSTDADVDYDPEDSAFVKTWATNYLNRFVYANCHNITEVIDQFTTEAAKILGKSKEMGSIEQGKVADFTVFENNPFDSSVQKFANTFASIVIVDSKVIYNEEEEAKDELCEMMFNMQV